MKLDLGISAVMAWSTRHYGIPPIGACRFAIPLQSSVAGCIRLNTWEPRSGPYHVLNDALWARVPWFPRFM